ncbi:MAG: glycosyltransferase [Bryobacteraceae bacterium]
MISRTLRALPFLLISPLVIVIAFSALVLTDILFVLFGKRREPANAAPETAAASVVIPNWNGRDLLAKYLPSVVAAMAGHPGNEVIVVDNGSSDGSAEFLREKFPGVRVVALPRNLGFGGGSNAGFRAAKNDIVVLLNSDMRVEQDFLAPLLAAFTADDVFAVSCQIFFSDPAKLREETGLTQGWWENGGLRVRHRIDDRVDRPFPCFYGGGGSCAFDRRKFLELGGFDGLLRPFYLEDTDLGYMAWKRGWKVLYQPKSVVYHEHRGTIGKKFSADYIRTIVQKNFLLFAWKNIHETGKVASHFLFTWTGALLCLPFGDSVERPNFGAMARAFVQLPGAVRSRWRARAMATCTDSEAFRRPMGGYFRDRFQAMEADPARPRVLFVSPYPICPPVHGGGVFMYQTCRELAKLTSLHLLVYVDKPAEIAAHAELAAECASAAFAVKPEGSTRSFGAIEPHAVHEFRNGDLEWAMHREILLREIDIVQLEYLPLAQYRCEFRRIPQILFEHDLYFQTIGRQLPHMRGAIQKAAASFEYLRALRYEMRKLGEFDRVQVCSRANREYLLEFAPELGPKTDAGLRAGVAVESYPYRLEGRAAKTMLFLGSFRHLPNLEALYWFVNHVFPRVLERIPEARFVVIGSDPPPRYSLPDFGESMDLRGYVDDILTPLTENALFLCPILAGSGVRVKLLEAFSCGIPVVSTTVGAEGLATRDGEVCALADDPVDFADKIVWAFENPAEAQAMAVRARAEVERNWDMPVLTARLLESYKESLRGRRAAEAGVEERVHG